MHECKYPTASQAPPHITLPRHPPTLAKHLASHKNITPQAHTTNHNTPPHTHGIVAGDIYTHQHRPHAHLPIHTTRPAPSPAKTSAQTQYTSHTTTHAQRILHPPLCHNQDNRICAHPQQHTSHTKTLPIHQGQHAYPNEPQLPTLPEI